MILAGCAGNPDQVVTAATPWTSHSEAVAKRATSDTSQRPSAAPLDWKNIGFLTLVHVAAVAGLIIYLPRSGLVVPTVIMAFGLAVLTIFSISAGYHRLFAHKTYEAHPVLRWFLLVFGAGAFQNSVLSWASDHRRHHGKTDSDLDPYDARRGFWHSHLGWVVHKTDPELELKQVNDLQRDPLVCWQHRNYAAIGAVSGLLLPTLLGLIWGDPMGGFVMGAAVRLLLCYHITFAINSFAHYFGTQPYSDRSSARDSFFVALLSMGEGYHNFHHTFPSDYRNGVRGWQFDPTKWTLWLLAKLGLARNLKRTSLAAIFRARLDMDQRRLDAAPVPVGEHERLRALRATIHVALDRLHELGARCEGAGREASHQAHQMVGRLRAEMRLCRRELGRAYQRWQREVGASLASMGEAE